MTHRDDAGLTAAVSAIDPSHYYGLRSNQPSIEIEGITNLWTDRSSVRGGILVTDESDEGPDFEAAIETVTVHVEYRQHRRCVRIDALTCHRDPGTPLVFRIGASVHFDCDLVASIPPDAKAARLVGQVTVFNRDDKVFIYRQTLPLPQVR